MGLAGAMPLILQATNTAAQTALAFTALDKFDEFIKDPVNLGVVAGLVGLGLVLFLKK